MLKTTIDPHSQLYITLKDCFTNQKSINLCNKMLSHDAQFIIQKFHYDLINFYSIEFKKNSEAEDVFKILVASEDYIFSEKEKGLFMKDLYVKIKPIEYYKKKYLGGC